MPQLKLSVQCHLHAKTMFVHPAQGVEGLCPKLPDEKQNQFLMDLLNHHRSSRMNLLHMKNHDRRAEHGERSESDQLTPMIGPTSTYEMYSEYSEFVVLIRHG